EVLSHPYSPFIMHLRPYAGDLIERWGDRIIDQARLIKPEMTRQRLMIYSSPDPLCQFPHECSSFIISANPRNANTALITHLSL
ncbi:Uncharacterized protein DAT39_023262, partial [Clarias magur]